MNTHERIVYLYLNHKMNQRGCPARGGMVKGGGEWWVGVDRGERRNYMKNGPSVKVCFSTNAHFHLFN